MQRPSKVGSRFAFCAYVSWALLIFWDGHVTHTIFWQSQPVGYDAPFYYLFSISWYPEFDFLISINKTHFLISMNRIPDIKKSFLDIKKSVSWYQEMYSEAPFYYLLSIKISWYQEIDFLISRNGSLVRKRFWTSICWLVHLLKEKIMSTYLNFLQKLEKCMLISWNITSFVDFILVQ